VRVFCGVSIRQHTRVMIVEDWIFGQLTGSRRSRRCYEIKLVYDRMIKRRNTNIHIQFSREKSSGRGM
jgi:hypothetical protein